MWVCNVLKKLFDQSFVDFIISHKETGRDTAETSDGWPLYWGQGYNNGSNMAGEYEGVRAHNCEVNASTDPEGGAASPLPEKSQRTYTTDVYFGTVFRPNTPNFRGSLRSPASFRSFSSLLSLAKYGKISTLYCNSKTKKIIHSGAQIFSSCHQRKSTSARP